MSLSGPLSKEASGPWAIVDLETYGAFFGDSVRKRSKENDICVLN